MTWQASFDRAAREELRALPRSDRAAIENAVLKLIAVGDRLGTPHSSSIRGASETLRELRPRSGRSRWRAFYRRVGDQFVIAAIGPEASVDPAGFRRAIANALNRLNDLDRERKGDRS